MSSIERQIKDLQSDRPKIMGYDYYNIIYTSCGLLAVMMYVVYQIVDDPSTRKMVLTQGALSLCLVGALMFYQW